MTKKLSSSSFKVSVAPESGADATTYWLLPSTTQVKRKADGTHLPEYVSCEAMAKTGDGNPVTGIGTIKFALTYKTGSSSSEFLYASRIIITSDMSAIIFKQYVGGIVVDTKTVTVVDDGQQGETGVRGRMPFPSGAFDFSSTYTATDSITPIVYYEAGKTYYVMNKTCTVTGLNPATDYAQNGSNATWIPFENYKAIFTEILMANFAKLASAVFCGDYMFSQHGKDANGNGTTNYSAFDPTKIGQSDCPFTPNTFVDWLTGTIRTRKLIADGAELTNVKGLTGAFRRLQGVKEVDKKDVVMCEIGFSANEGKMYFEGDMQHQGQFKNPDGTYRSYRFLTADLWCRNEFGHRKMTSMSFSSSFGIEDYFAHIYEYGTDTVYHKYAEAGQPIDCIFLEGSGNYVLRVCDSARGKFITIVNNSAYPKKVIVVQQESATTTIEPYKFKIFVTAEITSIVPNPNRVVNLFELSL